MESETLILHEDIIIPPLRNTSSLEISPDETQKADLARKQLENLNKIDRKVKRRITPPSSDAEVNQMPMSSKTDIKIFENKAMHNLSSAIVSKAELENEIRKKVAKQEPSGKKLAGSIEIPQELILSAMNTTPIVKVDDEVQLHDQELIDILEGKSETETETFEVVQEGGVMVLVKDTNEDLGETTSYEIIQDPKATEVKAKLLEREIAMRQIASLPVRKNKKSINPSSAKSSPNQSIAQIAAEWTDDDKDDEVILEVVNMESDPHEPKIKILNMTILNEMTDAKPKVARQLGELQTKPEPKILNKEAPKILNINASSAEAPASFKRSRVKKEIWDPSQTKSLVVEKKTIDQLPLSLPPSITIKKLTKESISKAKVPVEEIIPAVETVKPAVRRVKKRSEIDKLMQDEGVAKLLLAAPEIETEAIDKTKEKSPMVTKAKVTRNVVQKQSASPPEIKPAGRARVKRDLTPSKQETTEPPAPTASKTPKAPVNRKKKSDNSWDFIYSQAQATCDDAMIIRRHSNSSYSSSAASPRRLSVDILDNFDSPPPSAKKSKQEVFEFTKPPQKNSKSPADKLLSKDFVEELRGKISNVLTKNKEKLQAPVPKGRKRAAPQAAESTPAKRASERRSNGSENKEYRLEKNGNLAHIILNQNPLSIGLLSEMKSLLNQLETDECQVVLITSTEGFSEGLDYSTLVQTTVDKRKQAASDLVTAYKNFLISLAAFPKLLVCGLKGLSSGISVTMLPLFDVVFAESGTTFSLPHANIGSNPEGISILQFSGKIKTSAINQLLYLNETLDANQAYNCGLVTKIIEHNDFDTKLMSECTRISDFSSQALESTKSLINEDFLSFIDGYLAKEVKILQQQWISAECQEKFKKHSSKGEW